jgi:hypothetical protein
MEANSEISLKSPSTSSGSSILTPLLLFFSFIPHLFSQLLNFSFSLLYSPHCSVIVVQCENCGGLMENPFPPSSSPSLSSHRHDPIPPSPSPKATPPLTSPSSSSSSKPFLKPTPPASPHLSPPSPKSLGTTSAVSPSLSNSSSSSSSSSSVSVTSDYFVSSPPSFQSTFCVWCGFLNIFDCRLRKQLELPPIFPMSFDAVVGSCSSCYSFILTLTNCRGGYNV